MKIRVELINGNEHRTSSTSPQQPQQNPSVSHIFDGETAVKDHIKVLLTHFKIPVDKVSSYALQNPFTLAYVEDSFLTPERLVEAEKSYFILRMKPHAIADRVVDQLTKIEPTSPHIKDTIFNIRYQMKDVEYVEEFIIKGGINQLLAVIIKSRGNTQSYALTALRCFMGYNSGLEEVMSRPQLIDKLYSLVCSVGVLPSVCRQAIELLFCVCNFDGFQLVHRSAKNHAQETSTPAYSNLITLLSSGDMETQLNTLTLFNCLLDNAPNPRKSEKLLSRWQQLGIIKILKSQEHVTHSDFRTQIARFQANSGFGIDGSGRKRTLTRQLSTQELEFQLHQFREQQPLISLLTSELKFLRNAIKSAIENGSYINYRAPTERYDEYSQRKLEMIGDSPTNLQFLKRNDKFTNAFRKSMYVRSPNTSDLFDSSTLEDTYDGNNDTNSCTSISTSSTPIHISQPTTLIVPSTTPNHHPPQQSQQTPPLQLQLQKDKEKEKDKDKEKEQQQQQQQQQQQSNKQSTPKPNLSCLLSPITISNTLNNNNNNNNNTNNNIIKNNNNNNNCTIKDLSPIVKSEKSNENEIHEISLNGASSNHEEPIKYKLQPTKSPITPSKRMKPLHWTRILNSQFEGKKTIWNSYLPEVTFEEELFVDLFSLYTERIVSFSGSPVVGSGTSISGGGPIKSKPIQKVISVLSQKRSNAIIVMCGKLPSDDILIRAIRNLDSNKLSLDGVSSIISNFPTSEELASIHELHSNEVILDKPERWCLMIDGFPMIKHRLRCWEFMLKIEDSLKSIIESIDTVLLACKELRTSITINCLFSLLLQLGNYLNGGHLYRGQSDGFNLESLSKMIEIKDNSNSGSLLDFAIKTLYQQSPMKGNSNTSIHLELAHVPNASLINFTDVGTSVSKLLQDYSEIVLMSDEIQQTTDKDDPFLDIVPKFMSAILLVLKNLQTKFLETEKYLFETIDYFNPTNQTLQQYQQQQYQQYQQQQFQQNIINNNNINNNINNNNISGNTTTTTTTTTTTSTTGSIINNNNNNNNNIINNNNISQSNLQSLLHPQYYLSNSSSSSSSSYKITPPLSSSLSITSQEWNQQKFTCEKFFTLFSTITTAFKKSPSKRLSQKGFGLKISNSDDPMAVIIEALKTGSPNDMVKRAF
ncbi:hypothetical protein ACTFIW_013175 [Dictyostelium discoideum]